MRGFDAVWEDEGGRTHHATNTTAAATLLTLLTLLPGGSRGWAL